jgi:hypothetical protein
VSRLSIGTASVTRCAVTETHVEIGVECPTGSTDCRAVKMRRSLTDTRPHRTTPLDEEPIVSLLFKQLPLVAPGVEDGTTLTMRFFNDTTQLAVEGPELEQFVDPTHLPAASVSRRLTLLLNTYHQAFLVRDISILFGESVNDTARYGHDFNRPLADMAPPVDAATANWTALCPVFCSRSSRATLMRREQVYACHRAWLALLFACAAALLAAGVAGMALGARALVPDMLGYAASMTYNNPHFALPGRGRGGVLDAMDRARVLRNVRVRVGDVGAAGSISSSGGGGGGGVGRIAFTSRRAGVERLHKGGKYT